VARSGEGGGIWMACQLRLFLTSALHWGQFQAPSRRRRPRHALNRGMVGPQKSYGGFVELRIDPRWLRGPARNIVTIPNEPPRCTAHRSSRFAFLWPLLFLYPWKVFHESYMICARASESSRGNKWNARREVRVSPDLACSHFAWLVSFTPRIYKIMKRRYEYGRKRLS
jgi:hypothetical protein